MTRGRTTALILGLLLGGGLLGAAADVDAYLVPRAPVGAGTP